MVEIRIDPEQVDATGNNFKTKSDELDALTKQAQTQMNNLQAVFTGQRASAIFADWSNMQPSLTNAIQTLIQASDLLKRAAADFRSADAAK